MKKFLAALVATFAGLAIFKRVTATKAEDELWNKATSE